MRAIGCHAFREQFVTNARQMARHGANCASPCRLDSATKMARLGTPYCGAVREQNSCRCEACLRPVTLTNRSVGSFSYALVELSSLENEKVVSRLEDSTLHSDTSSRVDVVSGHHSYRYTGLLTLADCIRHLHPISRSSCA